MCALILTSLNYFKNSKMLSNHNRFYIYVSVCVLGVQPLINFIIVVS